jgi:hypothetical protein
VLAGGLCFISPQRHAQLQRNNTSLLVICLYHETPWLFCGLARLKHCTVGGGKGKVSNIIKTCHLLLFTYCCVSSVGPRALCSPSNRSLIVNVSCSILRDVDYYNGAQRATPFPQASNQARQPSPHELLVLSRLVLLLSINVNISGKTALPRQQTASAASKTITICSSPILSSEPLSIYLLPMIPIHGASPNKRTRPPHTRTPLCYQQMATFPTPPSQRRLHAHAHPRPAAGSSLGTCAACIISASLRWWVAVSSIGSLGFPVAPQLCMFLLFVSPYLHPR